MKSILFLVAVALIAPTASLAGQGADAPPRERIDATLRAAEVAGVPTTILESKLLEGRAKGVPDARIAAFLEERLTALLAADRMLRELVPDRAPPEPELTVATDAIQAGVDLDVLGTVHREAPDAQRVVAISVLAQVVRLGVSPERAATEVREAMRTGPEALLSLPVRVRARVRGGGRMPGDLGPAGDRGGGVIPRGIPLPGELRTRDGDGGREDY